MLVRSSIAHWPRRILRAGLALAAALALLIPAAASATTVHNFTSSFGSPGSAEGQFSSPHGVAVDQSSGTVYVADTANARVQAFGADGSFIRALGWGVDDGSAEYQTCTSGCQAGIPGSGPGQFTSPTFLATDSSGDLYVADTATYLVQKFDSSGALIAGWGSGGQLDGSASVNGPFGEIAGIAVDSNDDLFVLNTSGRIFTFEADSSLIEDFATPAGGAAPSGLALDSTGALYLAYPWQTVAKLEAEPGVPCSAVLGCNASAEPDGGPALGIAIDPSTDRLYVSHGNEIRAFEPGGSQLEPFGSAQLGGAAGIAIRSSDGRVYVADGYEGESGPEARIDFFEPALAPTPVTGEADEITIDSATLHGTVNPEGVAVTDCYFEFKQTVGAGQYQAVPCDESPGNGSSGVNVSADLSGLSDQTNYSYRLISSNALGTARGATAGFTTLTLPRIIRQFTTDPQTRATTLKAEVDPNGYPTTGYFEYGLQDCATHSCARVSATNLDLGSADITSNDSQGVIAAIHLAGLMPATTYHYRLIVESLAGTVEGPDTAFSTFRLPQEFGLPDGRVYEQVSPVNKNGGNVAFSPPHVLSAPDGDVVSFSSTEVFPNSPGAGATVTDFLATRRSEGWSTHGLIPPQRPGLSPVLSAQYQAYSLDLSRGVFFATSPVMANDPNTEYPNRHNLYLRLDLDDPGHGEYAQLSSCPICTEPLEPEEFKGGAGLPYVAYADATPDLHQVIFEDRYNLLPGASGPEPKLYEWDYGTLRLAGILPDAECGSPPCPASASIAGTGPGGLAAATEAFFGASWNTISDDGRRVFFAGPPFIFAAEAEQATGQTIRAPAGKLYMRVDHETTVQINVSEKTNGAGLGGEDPNGPRPATYLYATPSGSTAYFISREQLTNDDNDTAGDIYAYDTDPAVTQHLTRISVDKEPSDDALNQSHGGAMIGVSDDGSYVYFEAPAMLVPGQRVVQSQRKMYVWHEGTVRSIAGEDESGIGYGESPRGGSGVNAKVSPDGKHFAFVAKGERGDFEGDRTSTDELTGFASLQPRGGHAQTYTYDYQTDQLKCASCDQTGAVPVDAAGLGGGGFLEPVSGYAERNDDEPRIANRPMRSPQAISNDGRWVFFSTPDRLVPEDINSHYDAYEYDTATGAQHLISTGQCACNSYWMAADPSGANVYFATREKLVLQDVDDAVDLYDARIDGGIPSQNTPPQPGCEGDACQPTPVPPDDATPASSALGGSGNLDAVRHRRHPPKHRRHRHRRHRHRATHRRGGATHDG